MNKKKNGENSENNSLTPNQIYVRSLTDYEVVCELDYQYKETGSFDGDANDELIRRGIAVKFTDDGINWYYHGEEQ